MSEASVHSAEVQRVLAGVRAFRSSRQSLLLFPWEARSGLPLPVMMNQLQHWWLPLYLENEADMQWFIVAAVLLANSDFSMQAWLRISGTCGDLDSLKIPEWIAQVQETWNKQEFPLDSAYLRSGGAPELLAIRDHWHIR